MRLELRDFQTQRRVFRLDPFDLAPVLFDPACVKLCSVAVPAVVGLTLLVLALHLEELLVEHLHFCDLRWNVVLLRVSPDQELFLQELLT